MLIGLIHSLCWIQNRICICVPTAGSIRIKWTGMAQCQNMQVDRRSHLSICGTASWRLTRRSSMTSSKFLSDYGQVPPRRSHRCSEDLTKCTNMQVDRRSHLSICGTASWRLTRRSSMTSSKLLSMMIYFDQFGCWLQTDPLRRSHRCAEDLTKCKNYAGCRLIQSEYSRRSHFIDLRYIWLKIDPKIVFKNFFPNMVLVIYFVSRLA